MDKIAPIAILKALGRILKLDIDLKDLEMEAKTLKEQVAMSTKYLIKRREEGKA